MKPKDIKLLFHNDQAVMLKEFPNKFFVKHWDDVKKTDYIIVETYNFLLRKTSPETALETLDMFLRG